MQFPLRECVNLKVSNLYTWNESKFSMHLAHTNQPIFNRNMSLLYYSTQNIDKEKRKHVVFNPLSANAVLI